MGQFNRKPVRVVEFDVDFCSLTYGISPCTAALAMPENPRKCYNTFPTCQDKDNFNPEPLTLRFSESRVDLPAGGPITFPVLESVSPVTATVNIAGTNERFNGLGRRGTITATFSDFPYNDRVTDKYAAERKSGDAQLDEGGYNPEDRGSFFAKLKARWPTYGDRPFRFIEGSLQDGDDLILTESGEELSTESGASLSTIKDGTFIEESVRHYIITDFLGPDRDGQVRIEGKDILHLADDKKALCPRPSRGQMRFEINEGETTVELTPENIGDAEYPSEGWAALGREIVTFTRSGDILTLTGRGLQNTEARSHREGTTVQLAYRVVDTRIDDLVEDLLINFSNVPASFIPKVKWEEDVTRWASTLVLDTIITRPEGVQKLIAELAVLGVSVWWDDVKQEVGLKINAPVAAGEIVEFSDDANILDIHQEDNDEERLTQVHFYSVQTDPTGSATDKNNFDRIIVAIDVEAEQENSYRNPRIREVFSRWVNEGADSVLLVNALRLLSRFNTAPATYKVKIDNKDNSISLVDVVNLTSRVNQDLTGRIRPKLTQVRKKTTDEKHGWTNIELQDFSFDGQFRVIAPNEVDGSPFPVYGDATQAQKDTFAYLIAEDDGFFPDGEPAHQLI